MQTDILIILDCWLHIHKKYWTAYIQIYFGLHIALDKGLKRKQHEFRFSNTEAHMQTAILIILDCWLYIKKQLHRILCITNSITKTYILDCIFKNHLDHKFLHLLHPLLLHPLPFLSSSIASSSYSSSKTTCFCIASKSFGSVTSSDPVAIMESKASLKSMTKAPSKPSAW